MNEKKIDFNSLISFVRTNGLKILVRGVLSLCVAVLLLVLYLAFAPRSERYAVEVQVMLESRAGRLYYPNYDNFGAHDIISSSVLNVVWKKYGLGAKGVNFEDFCQWFGIINYDEKRAKIDAEFQTKLSKRNITISELDSVQRDYEARLATLDAHKFLLSMSPTHVLDSETAVRMLNDIPKIWFAEYSKLKGPLMPALSSGDAVKTYLEQTTKDTSRILELFDFLRFYSTELNATCSYIRNGLMRGRNISLDGVDLGVHESQLKIFNFELTRMKYRILTTVISPGFEEYIDARLENMACEQKAIDERITAVKTALEAFGGNVNRDSNLKPEAERLRGASVTTPVTVQADAGFFADFAAMVRRDTNQEFVRKYVEELTQYRRQLADLASRKLYYDQIIEHLKSNSKCKEGQVRSDDMLKELASLDNGLLLEGEKIIVFRDRCFLIYRTSDQFFTIAKPASYGKGYVFSLFRFAVGILALWAIYNVFFIFCDWRCQ